MPILQVEVIGISSGRSKNLARNMADAVAKTLKAPPGSVWVRLRVLPRRDYAECGADLSKDIQPVFVSLLKARPAPQKALQKEAMAVAKAIAGVCARPVENIHIFYEPPAAGRAAFGGRLLKVGLLLFFVFTGYSYCEQQPSGNSLLNVFIDCRQCDESFLKKEITFINYVRDRYESQVHLLATTQNTASGGIEYTLEFTGQKDFAGTNDILKLVTEPLETEDIRRSKLAKVIKAGLMRYVARTSALDDISISYSGAENSELAKDLWNNWVFTVSLNGNFQGEKSVKNHSFSNSLSANRITRDWKIKLNTNVNYAKDKFKTPSETITNLSRSYYFSGRVIKSAGDHWSGAIGGWGESDTYGNIRLKLGAGPKIEYNIFPYSESTKKKLCAVYGLNYDSVKYNEETIYDKTSENLLGEGVGITLNVKEKWGTISGGIFGSHYFHDARRYNLNFLAGLSLQIVKGFSFNFFGQFSKVNDQLSLKKGSASTEEVLLRRSQIATQYRYNTFIGISYTFGSLYSNIVNPRFDGLSISF